MSSGLLERRAAEPDAPGARLPAAAAARRVATAVLAAAASLAALTALLDEVSVHFVAGNSDGATVILEGAAVNSGNLALHGWAISLDSFWTLDVVVYAIAVRLWGLGPDLLTLVPSVLAAMVILLGAVLAGAGRRGPAAVAGAGVVVALLALPSPGLAFYLLQGPWHVGTVLAALVAFAALAQPERPWRWVAGVVVLAAALLGDVMILTIGVLPVAACGAVSLLRLRRQRRLRPGVALVLAAPAACLLALAVRVVAQAIGTFTLVNRNVPIRGGQLRANVGLLGNRLPGLLGVGSIPSSPSGGAATFQALHAVGLALVLVAVLLGLASLVRGAVTGSPAGALERAPGQVPAGAGPAPQLAGAPPAWRLDDLLVVGTLADVLTFVWAAGSDNPDYAKYLTPGVILAVVLAGRYVARLAERVRRRGVVGALAVGSLLVVGSYTAEVGVELSGPLAVQPAAQLAEFLRAHHLDEGVGDYWSSSIVTVESRGSVLVRPVTPGAGGRLRRYERQSPQSWYAGQRFDYFVYDLSHPWRNVNATTASRTWGSPASMLAVGSYRILVWKRPFRVSTLLPRYGSPLQIFWSPGAPRSSSTTSTSTSTTTAPAQ